MRLIDADSLMSKIKKNDYHLYDRLTDTTKPGMFTLGIEYAIRTAPTIDTSEYCDKLWKTAYERGKAEAHPKKGKWLPLADGWACCSECEHLERAAGLRWRYCPNCGARMEES